MITLKMSESQGEDKCSTSDLEETQDDTLGIIVEFLLHNKVNHGAAENTHICQVNALSLMLNDVRSLTAKFGKYTRQGSRRVQMLQSDTYLFSSVLAPLHQCSPGDT